MILKSSKIYSFLFVVFGATNLSAQVSIDSFPASMNAVPIKTMPVDVVMPRPSQNSFTLLQENVYKLNPIDPSKECVLEESDFKKLANVIEIKSCYENRLSYKDPNQKLDDISLLKSDNAICSCLRKKAEVNEVLNKVMRASADEMRIVWEKGNNAFKANDIKLQLIKQRQIELPFQASIIFGGDSELTTAYRNDFANIKVPEVVKEMNSLHNITQSNITDFDKQKLNYKNAKEVAIRNAKAKALSNLSKPEDILEEPAVLPAGQCVSGREYLAFKQLPASAEIFEPIVGKSGEFDERDWDYNYLKEQYYEIIDMPENQKRELKDKLSILRHKISFLHKNSMLRNLFSARSDFSYYESFLKSQNKSPEEQQKLKEMISNHLQSKKKELYEIVQKMNGTKDCKATTATCLKHVLDSKKIDDYKKSLKSFFVSTNPAIGEIVLLNSQAETFEELQSLSSGKVKKFRNLSELNQKAVESEFTRRTGLTPESCSKQDSDPVECAQIYALYCRKMDAVMVDIEAQSDDPSLRDDLDEKMAYDFEPKMDNNDDLKKFNDDLCNTKLKKNPKSKSENGMNFFEYKEKHCSNLGLKECRSKFISDYKASVPADAIVFSQILTKDPVVSVASTKDIFNAPAAGRPEVARDWGRMRSTLKLPDMSGGAKIAQVVPTSSTDKKSNGSNFSQNLSNFTSSLGSAADQAADFQVPRATDYNYGSMASAPQKTETSNEDEKQRNQPNNSKKEYDQVNSDPNKMAASSQEASTLKAKIDSLEQSLAAQNKVIDDLRRSEAKQAALTELKPRERSDDKGAKDFDASRNSGLDNTDILRAPASVKDYGQASVPKGTGQSSTLPSLPSLPSSQTEKNSPLSSSADSVEREEAKLVRLDKYADGSIEIVSTGGSGKSFPANAISLVVSDAQYELLSSNPTGLNLKELENRIPKDLIHKLEKEGEITIILRNGHNPPFEVKVEKKNNKLVYRLKDDKGAAIVPVKRIYTREALEFELKVQK